MLDYLLNTAHAFEREHGIAPDVIYINPLHYEQLARCNPELFAHGRKLQLGFLLVIVPASVLAHPRASLLSSEHAFSAGDDVSQQPGNEVAGWR